ncbi:MAG: zinc-dependent metalloprotease [Rubrivivax sp.]|nr:zinc-dependent metalloprotease [Rubrivivax sp.]
MPARLPVLRLISAAAAAAAVSWLTGCASLAVPTAPKAATTPAVPAASAAATPPTASAAPAPTVTPGVAAAARPDPAAPKPFADIIKDAKRSDGFLPVWRQDEKLWLEIPAERLNKPFLLTMSVTNSIGERGLYGSAMVRDYFVQWRQVGRTMQLMALNTAYRADGDAAVARALKQSFSDSLLASAPVVSAPHPERKSVLIDAAFLQADLLGYSTNLEVAYRLPYAVDRTNSFFDQVRTAERLTAVTAQLHFSTPRLPPPPLVAPPPGTPRVSPPTTVPDGRSFYVGVIYNFTALPDTPMRPRLADARIGHFTEAFTDLSTDFKPRSRVHWVSRWRLEKKDAAAGSSEGLSEPVKPVTFWLDKNIPARYRASIAAGVLEWNKAFERIGFRNAIVVQQQPDDATFDNMDAEHASIRWFSGADVGFARGPSVNDPRSGEIIDADIMMSDVFSRSARRLVVEDLGAGAAERRSAMAQMRAPFASRGQHEIFCSYADEAALEMGFAQELLEARGDITPDSPEAEALAQAYVKDTIMHEVGHTLGLKHNFRASTTVTPEQLRDKAWVESNGLAASVMDYVGFNLALKGEVAAPLANTTLGAYDYWAIEYAYRPLDAAAEPVELARIAARSTEPQLAFADDGDVGSIAGNEAADPRVNQFDLGNDSLAFTARRLALSRELWERVQARGLQPGDDPQRLRRSVAAGVRQVERLPAMVAKYLGGMYIERDLPGTNARPSYRPVEPARQRQALRFLTDNVFSAGAFKFKPEFLASAGPDYIEWERPGPLSISAAVLAMQTQTLDRLYAPGTAQRLLELRYYLKDNERAGAITLDEVYATLQGAVWSELKASSEIDPLRRNLQREHLRRLATTLTRPAPGLPADAVSLLRLRATELQGLLKQAAVKPGRSVETRAHLQESLALLTEALRATMQRG